VRQIAALGEVTEGLGELGPVGDEHWFVERSALGEAHECGDRGADTFDRLRARGDLLHVNAGR
jgi:hypothetical protein